MTFLEVEHDGMILSLLFYKIGSIMYQTRQNIQIQSQIFLSNLEIVSLYIFINMYANKLERSKMFKSKTNLNRVSAVKNVSIYLVR